MTCLSSYVFPSKTVIVSGEALFSHLSFNPQSAADMQRSGGKTLFDLQDNYSRESDRIALATN